MQAGEKAEGLGLGWESGATAWLSTSQTNPCLFALCKSFRATPLIDGGEAEIEAREIYIGQQGVVELGSAHEHEAAKHRSKRSDPAEIALHAEAERLVEAGGGDAEGQC